MWAGCSVTGFSVVSELLVKSTIEYAYEYMGRIQDLIATIVRDKVPEPWPVPHRTYR